MNENQLPPLSNLGKALLAAQQELEGVSKDASNPHFGSDFASLTAVIEATVPILNKHGIVVIQLPTQAPFEGHLALTTMLLHAESGESLSGTAVIPLSKNDPQAYGSAMTYGRRQSLGAAVSLKFKDDDAESAVGRGHALGTGNKVETPPAPKGLNFGGKGIFANKKPIKEEKAEAPKRGKSPLFPKVGKAEEGSGDEQA